MSLDRATVAHIARLARIALPEDRQDAVAIELSAILGWVEQLGEVDTDAVEPLRKVMDIPQALRSDEVADGGIADDILANAPERQDDFFVVPRVVE